MKLAYRLGVKSLICVCSIFSMTGCTSPVENAKGVKSKTTKYTVTKDIVYTPNSWDEAVKGDFYRPRVDGKSPVVLLVHGGGWAENDNRYQMGGIARKLARRGFAVLNVTYRLAPDYHFPAPVDDLLEAIKWLEKNQTSLNIDTQRLGVYGYSAGGHLAELATMREMPKGVRVKAVIAGGTPHFMRVDPDFGLVRDFIGKSYKDEPSLYHQATPVDQVGADFPPVFIYHGADDELVPPLHVHKWVKRLKELDVEHQVHWVKGRGHVGAFILPKDSVTKAIHFLEEKL